MFRAYSSSAYTIDLPEGHRFPMYKYAGTREKLVQDGALPASAIIDPPRPSWEQVERVHTSEYLKKLRFGEFEPKELRLLGFPWSSGLVERAMRAAGGTMSAADDALRVGLGINLAGGTHHAFPGHAEGFCVLNDVAVAATGLLENAQVSRVFVLDLDVHQGNGTAAIFNHDSRVFTLSVHGERNYPFHKEHSSLDIGLADGVTDAEYLDVLESRVLPTLYAFRPEIVFYLAGVDVLARDRFGRFALSLDGAQERDRRVFQTCRDLEIPVVSLMSGGYNKDHAVTVSGHANTVSAALEIYGF
jgi:acetoin utilization deacetylase AcuC-like enzyme